MIYIEKDYAWSIFKLGRTHWSWKLRYSISHLLQKSNIEVSANEATRSTTIANAQYIVHCILINVFFSIWINKYINMNIKSLTILISSNFHLWLLAYEHIYSCMLAIQFQICQINFFKNCLVCRTRD